MCVCKSSDMKTIQKIIDKSKEEIQSIYLHTNKYSNLNIMLRLLSGVKNNLLIRNSIGNVSSTTKKHVMTNINNNTIYNNYKPTSYYLNNTKRYISWWSSSGNDDNNDDDDDNDNDEKKRGRKVLKVKI